MPPRVLIPDAFNVFGVKGDLSALVQKRPFFEKKGSSFRKSTKIIRPQQVSKTGSTGKYKIYSSI